MTFLMGTTSEAPKAPWVERASAGFALAALVLLSVAIVAPEIGAVAGSEARTAALADVNAIGVALRLALHDDPMLLAENGGSPLCWLFGPGVLPRGDAWAGDGGLPLSALLSRSAASVGSRRDSYLDRVPIDPWARAYVVLIPCAKPARSIVILSAGPDGIVQSQGAGGAIGGDDVGLVLNP
jgi:hypothetical protein